MRQSGMKAVGQLRLVCKAWKACISLYPGDVTCKFDNGNLKKLCNMMPNMTAIKIQGREYAQVDLRPLRKCLLLTRVKLDVKSPQGCQDSSNPIRLQDLPASVKDITLHKAYVKSNSYQMMTTAQAAAIKGFACHGSDYDLANVWSWLDYLTSLEVRPSAFA